MNALHRITVYLLGYVVLICTLFPASVKTVDQLLLDSTVLSCFYGVILSETLFSFKLFLRHKDSISIQYLQMRTATNLYVTHVDYEAPIVLEVV